MVAVLEQRVNVGIEEFAFEICRKSEDLGGVATDHYWIDTRKLYGGKGGNKNLAIHREIMRLYRRCCLTESAFEDPETRETFLLATLVPHVRTTGCQNVMVEMPSRVRWMSDSSFPPANREFVPGCTLDAPDSLMSPGPTIARTETAAIQQRSDLRIATAVAAEANDTASDSPGTWIGHE